MSLQSRLSDLITAIGADIKILRSVAGVPYYRSGKWYTGRYTGQSGGLTLTQNVTYYLPFRLGKAATFDRMGIGVVTQQVGSNVRAGIWSPAANGDWPGALVYDAGLIDSTVAGQRVSTVFAQTWAAGLYFLGINAQGGTAGVQVNRLLASFDVPFGSPINLLNSGSGGILLTETGVAGAFGTANSANFVENMTSDLPRIGLKVA